MPADEVAETGGETLFIDERRPVEALGGVLDERLQLDRGDVEPALDQHVGLLGQRGQEGVAVDLDVVALQGEAVAAGQGLIEEEVGAERVVLLLRVDARAESQRARLAERGAAIEQADLGVKKEYITRPAKRKLLAALIPRTP